MIVTLGCGHDTILRESLMWEVWNAGMQKRGLMRHIKDLPQESSRPFWYFSVCLLGRAISQITRFMWPTWSPPGSYRPQVGSMLVPWTSISGILPSSRQWQIQYIPRNMHTVFALLCFVVVIHWLIFPYPSGLLHWHCGNLTIAPVPAKQPWWIWINTSCEFIMNDCTTKAKHNKTVCIFLGIYCTMPSGSCRECPWCFLLISSVWETTFTGLGLLTVI